MRNKGERVRKRERKKKGTKDRGRINREMEESGRRREHTRALLINKEVMFEKTEKNMGKINSELLKDRLGDVVR